MTSDPPIARWHAKVVERSADVALSAMPVPLRILDVGSGTGELLREIVVRVPYGEAYVGVEPSAKLIAAARKASDPRIGFVQGTAETLPFPDASFDLVLTCTSFGQWSDQRSGVAELARVVRRAGKVVLVDRSASWLRGKGRARTPRQVRALLVAAGLRPERVETLHRLGFSLPLVRAFIASL